MLNEEMRDDLAAIAGFLREERRKVLSEAEWRFRMRGYGYDLTRTEEGVRVSRLPRNRYLGTIAL